EATETRPPPLVYLLYADRRLQRKRRGADHRRRRPFGRLRRAALVRRLHRPGTRWPLPARGRDHLDAAAARSRRDGLRRARLGPAAALTLATPAAGIHSVPHHLLPSAGARFPRPHRRPRLAPRRGSSARTPHVAAR